MLSDTADANMARFSLNTNAHRRTGHEAERLQPFLAMIMAAVAARMEPAVCTIGPADDTLVASCPVDR